MLDRNFLTARLLLIASITVLASCTTPYWQPEVHFAPDQPTNIVGVKQLLKTSRTGEVDVITIHGMCTHDGKWASQAIMELSSQLGNNDKFKVKPIIIKSSNAVVYKRQVETNIGKVNISAIVWSPILKPLKEGLCYDQKVKAGEGKRNK